MTKKFIQIQSHKRNYKLHIKDIKHVYQKARKQYPVTPKFKTDENLTRK